MSDSSTQPKSINGSTTPAPPGDSDERKILEARWSEFDRWLRPEYVGDKPITLTISNITPENGFLNGKPVKCRALHFKEVPNMLALSCFNERTLAFLFGNKIGNCVSKVITLKKTRVTVARQLKTPLRIQRDAAADTSPDDPQYVPLGDPEDSIEGEEIAGEIE